MASVNSSSATGPRTPEQVERWDKATVKLRPSRSRAAKLAPKGPKKKS